jgi:hypothetical protein
MLTMLVAAIGFCSLAPALSVALISGVGLQPILPLMGLYYVLFPIFGLRVSPRTVIWVLVNLIGFTLSVIAGRSNSGVSYAVMQCCYVAAAGLGFGSFLSMAGRRAIFVNGYIGGALVSSALGVVQAVISGVAGITLQFTNSPNFSLVAPIGRAVAFTPEASVLAGLLLPAFVCLWIERSSGESQILRVFRSWGALLLLGTGLLATRSSSLLAAPLLLPLVIGFLSRSWEEFLASTGRTMLILAIAGLAFLPLYEARIEGHDDAGFSQEWRWLKIETGLRIFQHDPVLGVGAGYLADEGSFSRHLIIPQELAWMGVQPQKGVDSTPVRILAEGGLLGFVLFYYPLVAYWRPMRLVARSPGFRPILSLSIPLLYSQTVSLGYRDLLILVLPSVAFAVAGDYSRRSIRRGRPQLELSREVRELSRRLTLQGRDV